MSLIWDEIESCLSQGRTPIVVGGTGLYFDALFYNTDFGEMDVDPLIRTKLNERALAGEGNLLLQELAKVDPKTAEPLHEKDLKRIIRGLEVFYSTGVPLSVYKEKSQMKSSKFEYLKIFLNFQDRDKLYSKINLRVDEMVQMGLEAETRSLLQKGYLDTTTAAQAIGYKELLPYIRGERNFDECIEILKQKTRNYAKRQLTWFRRYKDAHTIWMDENHNAAETALKLCRQFLKEVES